MKGKKISNYDPFSFLGILTSLARMENGQYFRDTAITTETEKYTVDTVFSSDTGFWETGIICDGFNDNEWIIVDEYESKKDAEVGHDKRVKYMKKSPKRLYDVHISETYKFENK